MISRWALLDAIQGQDGLVPVPASLHAEADEKTINRWICAGMVGKLVRATPLSPITIEPCPDNQHGQWGIEVRS